MILRTDPRHVREILDYGDEHGDRAAIKHYSIHHSTYFRWRAERNWWAGWPFDDTIEAWDATRERRERRAENLRRYRVRRYLERGPALIDSTGTARRLQALARLGWLYHELGDRMGVVDERVGHLVRQMYPLVHRNTALAVARLYDELSMTIPRDEGEPGRRGRLHDRQRRATERKGWLAPLWWDDDRIDDPAYDPRPRRPPKRNLLAEVTHLRSLGVAEHVIAGQLGVTVGAIERAEMRAKSNDRKAS